MDFAHVLGRDYESLVHSRQYSVWPWTELGSRIDGTLLATRKTHLCFVEFVSKTYFVTSMCVLMMILALGYVAFQVEDTFIFTASLITAGAVLGCVELSRRLDLPGRRWRLPVGLLAG